MDELDAFWNTHFNRSASLIERRMIAAFDRTVGAEDPMFPILMMQVCNLYETLGSTEKAVLQHGPVLERQMVSLGRDVEEFSGHILNLRGSLATLADASERLRAAQQALLDQRELEDRVGSLPDWIKALMVALTTAIIMVLGGTLLALF